MIEVGLLAVGIVLGLMLAADPWTAAAAGGGMAAGSGATLLALRRRP